MVIAERPSSLMVRGSIVGGRCGSAIINTVVVADSSCGHVLVMVVVMSDE